MERCAWLPALCLTAGLFVAGQASAQDEFDLNEWDYEALYTDTWRAEELMDNEVLGSTGEEAGSVENLLINEQGQIVAVIAQVGGFWDIGDTHVAVPWGEISVEDGSVVLPINEDNVGEYSIFKEEYFSQYDVGELTTVEDDLETGPGVWKATDLIDDYVLLENEVGYGYVDDLIFNDDGELQSVVVTASSPNYGYGYYAYPWYGYGYDYGWDPGLDYYVLPFDQKDLERLDQFEYERIAEADIE